MRGRQQIEAVADQLGSVYVPMVVFGAGALGAVLGDSALYCITRTGPKRLKSRLEAAAQTDERVACGLALLGRSAPLLIARPLRTRRSLRRQRLDGSDRVPLPALSALLGDRRRRLGDLYLRARLLDKHRARRLRTRFNRDLRHRDDCPVAGVYWIDRRRHANDKMPATFADPEITGPS